MNQTSGRHRRLLHRPAWAVLLGGVAGLLLVSALLVGHQAEARTAGLRTASADLPVVQVDGGAITGVESTTTPSWSFRGIPFAAPPVGELRWQPPQPVVPWDDVRACTQYGPICPQITVKIPQFSPPPDAAAQQSEDCLYLNVVTPATTFNESLPVMVWIYGGSFINGSGSAPLYDGASLSQKGVVVVTFNYRLGPFGFFAHPALSAESPNGSSGNYGLLDQIAALEWVQRNIAGFGGDPGNVTIFGESAGADSVLDLMCSPLTDGPQLFHKAIAESAPSADSGIVIYSTRPLADGEKMGLALSKALGCADEPDELAALRDVPAAKLLSVGNPQQRLFQTGAPYTYQPYVDGWVLPEDPITAFAGGDFMHVPLVVGSNADEANIGRPVVATMNVNQLKASLANVYGKYAGQLFALFPPPPPPPKVLDAAKLSLLETVTLTVFTAPAQYVAQSVAAAGQPAYNYVFTGRPFGAYLGAFHSAELPYVFGNDYMGFDPTIGTAAPLSAAMQDYWTSFAITGDPNGAGRAAWPTFSAAAPQTMMLAPDGLRIEQGYQADECAVADQLFVP